MAAFTPDPSCCPNKCRNCDQHHPILPGKYSIDCVLIGGRTHLSIAKKRRLNLPPLEPPPAASLTTIQLPDTIREQALFFDQIWDWFVEMKHENDRQRDELALLYSATDKGLLKRNAPLLWLQWASADGRRGQTRNQENWEVIWQSLVRSEKSDEARGNLVAWVSLRAMTWEVAPSMEPVPIDSSACAQGYGDEREGALTPPPTPMLEPTVDFSRTIGGVSASQCIEFPPCLSERQCQHFGAEPSGMITPQDEPMLLELSEPQLQAQNMMHSPWSTGLLDTDTWHPPRKHDTQHHPSSKALHSTKTK